MQEEWSDNKVLSLIKISSLINSSLNIVDVLNSSMRFVEELAGAEASAIFEIDFRKNELFFRLARGECSGKVMECRMKMGEGIVGWVASSGETLTVPDTRKDKRFSQKVDEATGFRTKSIIAVPVKSKGRIIGVLEVLNKKGPRPFDAEDASMLTIAAGQIGVAIDNARLYTRLKERFTLTQDELKESQIKLIRSERLAALGRLAHGIAHSIRNPVTSIGGFARRIKKKVPLEGTTTDYLDAIITEAERLEGMVKDIGDYTSMPEPEPAQIKISELLQHTLNIWQREYGSDNIKLELSCTPDDPIVFVDIELMSKALILLMNNSREAFSKDGIISLSTSRENKWIVITVRDNGSGINSRDMPYIFDPFFSTKVRGAGLGLTIVNDIVSGHRGEVHISSSGKGTEAKICFPPYSLSEF